MDETIRHSLVTVFLERGWLRCRATGWLRRNHTIGTAPRPCRRLRQNRRSGEPGFEFRHKSTLPTRRGFQMKFLSVLKYVSLGILLAVGPVLAHAGDGSFTG